MFFNLRIMERLDEYQDCGFGRRAQLPQLNCGVGFCASILV